ncbi:MAG TPA: acyl-CoA dehydrogenase family protein [Herpetosiphonaceae bacterium]
MQLKLTSQQQEALAGYTAFVDEHVLPHADAWDQAEHTPPEIVTLMARQGYLGTVVPAERGGTGSDFITLGLLHGAIGRGCSSLRSLLTVHSMVAFTIDKWGSREHKARWLPPLVSGEKIGAFGLSEPGAGSDAARIQTSAVASGESFILNGHKKWTTYGQIADLFLIFATSDGKPAAFLVERDTPGLEIKPIRGMLGTRASMLAELTLTNCEIPKTQRIGGLGFGLALVATSALDIGRYSVAWGSVGIIQACLEASLAYTSSREQFGAPLKEHQLIQQMIANMRVNHEAARLLCYQAGFLKDTADPETVIQTWMAKYFASTHAMQAAIDAVQIHGANGCSPDYPVQRYFRDAKIMEIIEGSNQIQQITIANDAQRLV